MDADRIFKVTRRLVQRVADEGQGVVIVGRGGAYFLHERSDAFHVFVYGSPKVRSSAFGLKEWPKPRRLKP